MTDYLFVVCLVVGTVFLYCVFAAAASWFQSHVDRMEGGHDSIGGLYLSREVDRGLRDRYRALVALVSLKRFRHRTVYLQRRTRAGVTFQQAHYAKHHPRISAWRELTK